MGISMSVVWTMHDRINHSCSYMHICIILFCHANELSTQQRIEDTQKNHMERYWENKQKCEWYQLAIREIWLNVSINEGNMAKSLMRHRICRLSSRSFCWRWLSRGWASMRSLSFVSVQKICTRRCDACHWRVVEVPLRSHPLVCSCVAKTKVTRVSEGIWWHFVVFRIYLCCKPRFTVIYANFMTPINRHAMVSSHNFFDKFKHLFLREFYVRATGLLNNWYIYTQSSYYYL